MAWTKVGFASNPMWEYKEAGQEIEGVYKGYREIEDTSGMHTIETKKGIFDFWGCGSLNYLLKQVKEGDKIKLAYQGREKKSLKINGKNVKKEIHIFDVQVDK